MQNHRFIYKEIDVETPIAKVWEQWTTKAGLEKIFSSQINFRLEVGGPIEVYFDEQQEEGLQGSEGCQVLAFEPEAFLSFTWNAPPHLPKVRSQRTFVEVRFMKIDEESTKVELYHHGWGNDDEWTAAYNYFDNAWNFVMDYFHKSLQVH